MDKQSALKDAFRRNNIKGKIKALANALYKLASPSDKSSCNASFISLRPEFKPAADYEGSLGSLILETLVGTAFSEAINETLNTSYADFTVGPYGLDDAAEAASTLFEERTNARNEKNKGKGSFALGEHKSICNHFEDTDLENKKRGHGQVRQRLIEQSIAMLIREYDAFNISTPQYA
ncbi:MAG: hypothetical protein IT559_02470 [Alphaproteobacteria bacterium]|nr:hypothetical protein [Alphaproteobacteria bacterium]